MKQQYLVFICLSLMLCFTFGPSWGITPPTYEHWSVPDSSSIVRSDLFGPDRPHRRPLLKSAAMVTSINLLVHGFDRFVMDEEFAQVNLKSIGNNFKHGFVWDNDKFSTNLFAHPYHGNLYYNAARSQGLSFWQSAPFALGGSLMWEFMGEIEPPAINDVLATTIGGIALGEMTHRVSAMLLDDSKRGFNRFLREFGATVINPMQGLTRLMNGDAWRIRRRLYHDDNKIPVNLSVAFGQRYLADNGSLFRGEYNPYLDFYLEYGDPFSPELSSPYDYFTGNITFGLSVNQPLINAVHIMGRLWSCPIFVGKDIQAQFGIFQHFNYYDSSPVKDGTSLTPYRISEAASFGPGFIYRFNEIGNIRRLEQRIYVSGILLGGTKTDYYNVIDRDYNMGSGYSIKGNLWMDFARYGKFIVNMSFYDIYTWKGYEQKDMSHINPLYLNAQGDKGNAKLLVLNPMFIIELPRRWNVEFSTAYYQRRSFYKYHPNVEANTFEVRLGTNYIF